MSYVFLIICMICETENGCFVSLEPGLELEIILYVVEIFNAGGLPSSGRLEI